MPSLRMVFIKKVGKEGRVDDVVLVDKFIRRAAVLKGCTTIQPMIPPMPADAKLTRREGFLLFVVFGALIVSQCVVIVILEVLL